ncbi:MAG: hypothetical protein AAF847_12070 [Bacteroidota bacterium]
MRKIDKTCNLSVAYRDWEASIEGNHEKFTDSATRAKYYKDVIMQLFYCQQGLCAYTERLLCDDLNFDVSKWEEGKYVGDKPEFEGQVEHFDESLKSKSGEPEGRKDWLWANLFMVHSDTNTKVKSSHTISIDSPLKPDRVDYSPFDFFEGSIVQERFFFNAKEDLEEDLKEEVELMIAYLGINYGTLPKKRYIELVKRNAIFSILEDYEIIEYTTTFELFDQREQLTFNLDEVI